MKRAFLGLLCVACATNVPLPAHPLALAPLPEGALAFYEHNDRSFSAPPGGTFDRELVRYPNDGVVFVAVAVRRGEELNDERLWPFLQLNLGALEREPTRIHEHEGDVTILCLQGDEIARDAGPRRGAVCARVRDADVRRGEGTIVIAVFEARRADFDRLGGVRAAAQTVRSARGFAPPD